MAWYFNLLRSLGSECDKICLFLPPKSSGSAGANWGHDFDIIQIDDSKYKIH